MKDNKKPIIQIRSGLMLICLIGAFFLVSCASSTSTLSTRASRVRLISAMQAHDVEAKCDFLANVAGSYPYGGPCLCWGITGCWTYNSNALNELLDHAAELGATHVFVNLGNAYELRGEAYCCAYCKRADGTPDVDYCQLDDGSIDVGYCQGVDGKLVGVAHCEDAEGKDRAECEKNCGRWIPALNKSMCESQGHTWIPEAETQSACEARGGMWRPKAKDRATCESKGGTWVINEDVLRGSPKPAKRD